MFEFPHMLITLLCCPITFCTSNLISELDRMPLWCHNKGKDKSQQIKTLIIFLLKTEFLANFVFFLLMILLRALQLTTNLPNKVFIISATEYEEGVAVIGVKDASIVCMSTLDCRRYRDQTCVLARCGLPFCYNNKCTCEPGSLASINEDGDFTCKVMICTKVSKI